MGKQKKDIILYDIREFLDTKDEFKKLNIHAVFIKDNDRNDGIALTFDKEFEYGIKIRLKDFSYSYMYNWNFDFDNDIFKELKDENSIVFISDEENYNIWTHIYAIGVEEIKYQNGWQKYLKYCKDNGITKEYLDKKFNANIKDMMSYYNGEQKKEIIVKSEQYQEESEIHYIVFTLGYDLINEMLIKADTANPLECDIAYDFCDYVARKFIKTDYYKDMKHSTYEMLQEWVSDNQEIIQSEYLCYSHKDNKCIIETGKRNSDKVALVEHKFKDGTKEYIVAFHYEVNDKKVDWSYGYYYGDDLKKAKEDFKKVKAGGNLSNTFKEQNKKKHKERER